jgi:cobalamin-dependent methionine synthase I
MRTDMPYPLNIIGESLNASIPSVKDAIVDRDDEKVTALAIRQAECGAHMLDVNAAVVGSNEPEDLVWMMQTVQSVVDLPLVMDSSDPKALQAALKVYDGPAPILSSITGEMTEGHETLLSLAVEHDCGLVAMCMDDEGISPDPAKRLDVAERLFDRVGKAGLKPENLYIDPLVMAISADTTAGAAFLELLYMIRERLPAVHTFCGASNVSHGMPLRRLINHTFVSMLVALGMDSFLVNVRDQGLMATFLASAALVGQDEWSMDYIGAFRAGKLDVDN